MSILINLTPHDITFIGENGEKRIILPSGKLARVAAKTVTVGSIDGIPVTATEFGEVEGLPEPAADTIYIVSSLVAQRVPERTDVYVPSESVRDENGRIIGCKSLGKI